MLSTLQLLGTLLVGGLWVILLKSPADAYLTKGDLTVKADAIRWLGIDQGTITWGNLSVISAGLISLGTIFLTMLMVTGLSVPGTMDHWPGYFPAILILALVL
ncbi:MAG: hypothetical protein AB1445_13350 [Bacillota bacterium]